MKRASEPQAVREVHEIRERLHEARQDWTDAERGAEAERIGGALAQQLGLRVVPHVPRRRVRQVS